MCGVGLRKHGNETCSARNYREVLTGSGTQLVGPCLLPRIVRPYSFSTSFTSRNIKDLPPSDVGYNTSVSFGVYLFKQTIAPKDNLKFQKVFIFRLSVTFVVNTSFTVYLYSLNPINLKVQVGACLPYVLTCGKNVK